MGDHLVGCSSYTTPEFPAGNSIGMLWPRSIKSLTLEGILKLSCKQWFRRLTSSHNYVFLRLLLSQIWGHTKTRYCRRFFNINKGHTGILWVFVRRPSSMTHTCSLPLNANETYCYQLILLLPKKFKASKINYFHCQN